MKRTNQMINMIKINHLTASLLNMCHLTAWWNHGWKSCKLNVRPSRHI